MAQDWRARQEWRNEERRRMEEDEQRLVRQRGYREGRDYDREQAGAYEDYGEGRPYRGYEPTGFPGIGGVGYVPSPLTEQRGLGRAYGMPSGYRPGERDMGAYGGDYDHGRQGEYGQDWAAPGYEDAYPRDRERGWWDRAKDEVRSWRRSAAAAWTRCAATAGAVPRARAAPTIASERM